MKKKTPYFRWVAVAAMLTVCIYACRKDMTGSPDLSQLTDPAVTLNTQAAQLYYFKQLLPQQGDVVTPKEQPVTQQAGATVLKARILSAPTQVNRKYVMFNKSYEGQTGKVSFVELPLRYNKRPSSIITLGLNLPSSAAQALMLNSSFDRMIIYKDKTTGKIDQKILTYLPDTSYLANHHNDASGNQINKLDKDFSGYIQYKSWNGTVLSILKLVNGKGVKRFYPNAPAKLAAKSQVTLAAKAQTNLAVKSVNSPRVNADVCVPVEDFDFNTDCWYADPEHNDELGCGTGWAENGPPYYLDDNYCFGDDSGSGGGDDPCLDPSNLDPTCNGGAGGGGDGQPYTTSGTDSSNEENYTDSDYGYSDDGLNTAPSYIPIGYVHNYEITEDPNTTQFLYVHMNNTTAFPISALYYDVNRNPVTRTLTLLNHFNTYTISGGGYYLSMNWSCSVNIRYVYADGTVYTRQISHNRTITL